MATQAEIAVLRGTATQVKNESQVGGNTAERVGGLFEGIVDALPSDEAIDGKITQAVADIQPIVIEGNVENAPDQEDLTSVNQGGTDVLKFKDKTYAPALFSGLGRVYLRKNVVTPEDLGYAINLLTSEMVNTANTIYHIQYDYDLNGQTITLPTGCVLEFDGGSVKNGALSGDFNIVAGLEKIFDNVTFTGACINNTYELDWFVGDKNTSCDLTSAKKDSTTEVQAAFDSGVMNIHISNQYCYYISSTLVVKSWVSLVGDEISVTHYRDNVQGEPSFYTDKAITLLRVVGDSDSNNKIQKEIILDNVHLRHYGPIGADDYHTETPVLYITNGTGVNSQVWGVNLNVNIYVADKNIPSLGKYMFGYTGIEIYADNGFYFTYININGRIYGCRRGVYIHKPTEEGGRSWVTDVRLGFDSTCVWGGQIDASPVRITGSHQPTVQLTKAELDENPYFFRVPKGVSTAMVWDLGTTQTVEGITYYNVVTAFYANSSHFFDLVTNSETKVSDDNILPVGSNYFRWNEETLWKFLPPSCNMLERTFNNVIGWQTTDNIAGGISFTRYSKERGMVESIRLYDSNENYIDLTEELVTNYDKLFTLGGITSGAATVQYIDSCGSNLKSVADGYTNFEVCFLYSKNQYWERILRDSYFCVFFPGTPDNFDSIFIEIEYCDATNSVLERKRFTFNKNDQVYYTGLYLRYAESLDSDTAYTYVRLRCRDNRPKAVYSRIAKFGLLNRIFLDNAITSSGGEITGMLCLRNVKYDLQNSSNGARYTHNKYIGKLFNIGTANYNSKVLNISVLNMADVYVTFVKGDSGVGIIKITKTSVFCSDKSINCKLDVHTNNYSGRYLLSLKSLNAASFYISDVFSTAAVKFIDVNETHESGYFDGTYYEYASPTSGATSARPAYPATGQTFFDTTLSKMIVYNGSAWVNMDGSVL